VRFSLDGDTLKAAVLWEGKDLNNTVPADIPMVYYAGRLYVGDTVVDALTGVAIDGKAMGRSAVPPTHHLLYVASDRLYGLEGNVRLCDGAPPPDKATVTLTCSSLDGRLLGAGTCTMAPIDDEKRTQIRSQVGWDSWAFGYGLPFTIAGDRLYLRSSDELICVGHAAKGAPGDDPKVVDAIRAETDAAKLAARLDDASAQYRCEAMARLAALKPALSDEARDALRKAVVEDLYEEVRAAAVLALDACDPEGNAGWTALAAEMTEAQAKAVPWGKPGFAESQERLRRARVTLRPLGDGGKAYLEKRWPDARTPALRYALLDTATACGWKVDAIVTDVLAALKDGNRWRNEPARRLLLPYLAAIDAAADPKLAEAIVGIHDWGLYATCRYHLSNAQFLSWLEPIAMTTMRPDDRNRALLNWRRIGAEAIPSMERVAARMGADEKNAQAKSYVDAINALIAELKAA
jgi:hypothetical protein